MNGLQGLDLLAVEVVRVIARQSLYVVPIFVVVATASRALRRRAPGLHFALWSLVLLRLVLPLDLGHPASATRLLSALTSTIASAEVAPGSETMSADITPLSTMNSAAKAEVSRVPWTILGVLAWAVGAVSVGRRMWTRRMEYRRLARKAPRIPELCGLTEKWKQRLGVRRRVWVVVTEAPVSPFTIGVVKPVIVLPRILVSRRPACEAAVAHEMAHVRRLDALWADVQRLLHCLFFFHPLIWYAGSRIDLERERLCDATVLRSGAIGPRSYAGALVDVADLRLETGAAPAFTQPRRRVHMRVHSILLHRTPSIPGRCAAAVFVLVLGVVFLPLAGEAEYAAPVATTDVTPPTPEAPPSQPVQPAAPNAETASGAAAVAPPAIVAAPGAPGAAVAPPAPIAAPQPAPVPMAAPVADARLSQGWGEARNPFTGDLVFHKGYDLAAPQGTPVHAGADGVVNTILVDDEGKDTGRFVIIDHGDGLTSYYGHLDEVLVDVGDRVDRGQTIATVGMTGLTTGPHIHFEVRSDGERIDPGLFVER